VAVRAITTRDDFVVLLGANDTCVLRVEGISGVAARAAFFLVVGTLKAVGDFEDRGRHV
jgi:hypothetical protein